MGPNDGVDTVKIMKTQSVTFFGIVFQLEEILKENNLPGVEFADKCLLLSSSETRENVSVLSAFAILLGRGLRPFCFLLLPLAS